MTKQKLKVNIEDDSFELEMRILEEETKTRRYLTITVFTIAVVLAIVAAIYGFVTGEFKGLVAVSLFVDAPVMSVLGYYYGKNHGKKDENESST